MTTSATLTHVLAVILGATISYFIFRCPDVPTELPPINDETAITIQVERRVRALEVVPIKNRLKATEAKLDSISKVKPRIKIKHEKQTKEHWNLNDSLSADLLLTRIRASMPNAHRSTDGKLDPR